MRRDAAQAPSGRRAPGAASRSCDLSSFSTSLLFPSPRPRPRGPVRHAPLLPLLTHHVFGDAGRGPRGRAPHAGATCRGGHVAGLGRQHVWGVSVPARGHGGARRGTEGHRHSCRPPSFLQRPDWSDGQEATLAHLAHTDCHPRRHPRRHPWVTLCRPRRHPRVSTDG